METQESARKVVTISYRIEAKKCKDGDDGGHVEVETVDFTTRAGDGTDNPAPLSPWKAPQERFKPHSSRQLEQWCGTPSASRVRARSLCSLRSRSR